MDPAERWTTPAATIGPAPPELQPQADRWRRWARRTQVVNPGDATIPPTISIAYESTSLSLYPASEATSTRQLWASATGGGNNGAPIDSPVRWGGPMPQFPLMVIPWHSGGGGRPAWRGADGTSDQFLLIDYSFEDGWEIQAFRTANWWDLFLLGLRQIGKEEQPRKGDAVCDSAARRTPDNMFKYTRRGMGDVPQRVGVVTAAEVSAARADGHRGVGHMLAIVATYSETGPLAECLSPATRVEFPSAVNNMLPVHANAPDPYCTKQGLVLASTLTEAEIDAILARIELDKEWRKTRKVWWMTLSEHGMCIGATTGLGDNTAEATTMKAGYRDAAEWKALGHTSQDRGRRVFTGYPWATLYVVAPAP